MTYEVVRKEPFEQRVALCVLLVVKMARHPSEQRGSVGRRCVACPADVRGGPAVAARNLDDVEPKPPPQGRSIECNLRNTERWHSLSRVECKAK